MRGRLVILWPMRRLGRPSHARQLELVKVERAVLVRVHEGTLIVGLRERRLTGALALEDPAELDEPRVRERVERHRLQPLRHAQCFTRETVGCIRAHERERT